MSARETAGAVRDPEMPMLTLEDLGVLRDVEVGGGVAGASGGRVVVTLTPTYSGCPALATMRDDVVRALNADGYPEVEVRISLSPPWSSDQITERGRASLRAHGLSAPGPVEDGPAGHGLGHGATLLTLAPTRRRLICPQCGSSQVELVSEFGPSACTALYRCTACREPFQHMKEH